MEDHFLTMPSNKTGFFRVKGIEIQDTGIEIGWNYCFQGAYYLVGESEGNK